MVDINKKVVNASKWSALSEIVAKLISPITSMVLARVLTPEAFGVVVTLNMIISFAEIFTDAGFQRYIIQHQFRSEEDKRKSTNVAFWANLVMSFIMWMVIAIFADSLSALVGNPGLGDVLIVACVSIPIAAFSSIQMALYKRSFDFKTLFYRRIIAVLIPIFITIPLAFIMRSYWALVIGTITVNIANAVVLTIKSSWRPSFYFSWIRLKKMIFFSIWSVCDAVLVWATSYLEIFFIGSMLSAYYVGLYKTAINTVTQFTSIVATAIIPVILPALSRLQNDKKAMCDLLLKMQKSTSIFLLPLGFGILIFRDLITDILLGAQWYEIVDFIGLWGVMEVITIVFSRFCSNIYPAIGKPLISVLVQFLHLIVLVPVVMFAIDYGFETLYIARSFVRLEGILVNFVFAYLTIGLSISMLIKNVFPEFLGCIIMGILGYFLLKYNDSILFSFLWIIVCSIVYFSVLLLFPTERKFINGMKGYLFLKYRKNNIQN